MASICNDERGRFGAPGGHGRKTLNLSGEMRAHCSIRRPSVIARRVRSGIGGGTQRQRRQPVPTSRPSSGPRPRVRPALKSAHSAPAAAISARVAAVRTDRWPWIQPPRRPGASVGPHPAGVAVVAPVLHDRGPQRAGADRAPPVGEGLGRHVGAAHQVMGLPQPFPAAQAAAHEENAIGMGGVADGVGADGGCKVALRASSTSRCMTGWLSLNGQAPGLRHGGARHGPSTAAAVALHGRSACTDACTDARSRAGERGPGPTRRG